MRIYIAVFSQKARRTASRIVSNPWLDYLEGKNAGYAEQALRGDLERIRLRVDGMRKATTTPDTRLADDPLPFNPASVESMIQLALGGLPPRNNGKLRFCQLRYFDSAKRRAGLAGRCRGVDRQGDAGRRRGDAGEYESRRESHHTSASGRLRRASIR